MNETAKAKFNEIRKIIDEHLDKYIPVKYPESIYEAMRYSLLSGGKRLRPVMAVETALLLGGRLEDILPAACAIEMLHCQSLIHDDLPCMDNDDFRRGKPSNHKVFGEAQAVLAGDALLSYAPQIIIEKTPESLGFEKITALLREFFNAAGVNGIVSGQIIDLESEKKKISKETLEFIYEYKTASMFKLAVRSGAIAAGADESVLQNLTLSAEYFGHAFQIYDDILDAASTFEETGKTPHKDEKSEKQTYVSMFGLEEAKKQAVFLCGKAYDILNKADIKSEILSGIVSDIEAGAQKCF